MIGKNLHVLDDLPGDDGDVGPFRNGDPAGASLDPLGTATVSAAAAAQFAHQVFGAQDAASGGDPSGQLWIGAAGSGIGNPDNHSDFRVMHLDSDGLADSQIIAQEIAASGITQTLGLDTSAGLFFSMSEDFHLRVSNIATGAVLTDTVIASTHDFDTLNCFAVNPDSNTLFTGLFGYDYLTHGGDIIKIGYNQTTGAITNPYTFNDSGAGSGSVDTNFILIDSVSTGNVYADARAMYLSHDASTLYYVDDNDNDPGNFWHFSTNGVFKVSTTGSVGGGNAPTPVMLTSQAAFPVNDSNGYINGIAVDEARGIIYFTTGSSSFGTNQSQNAIWWMPIAGGAATKMTIPGGVTFDYPVFFGDSIELDPRNHILYYADQITGEVVQFILSADGHSFTSASNFALFDTNHTSDGAYVNSMVYDDLPTLSALSATSTEAVQGGSAVTALTAQPTITDIDNKRLNHFTVTVTNAQTGDNLFVNGQQSGTQSGIAISWNSSTHALTLSGDVAFSTYQTLLSQVTYQDSGTDNSTGSHPTRTINWTANDGTNVVHASLADPNQQATTLVIDRAPTLGADSYAVQESGTSAGTSGTGGTGVFANDSDKDGDAFVITQVNGSGANVGSSVAGTYGHLTLNSNGSYSYNADRTANIDGATTGSHPSDGFTYQVSDGLGGLTSSTVTFTINRAPALTADGYNVVESAFVSGTSGTGGTGVLGNDSDKDGDGITVTAVAGSAGNVGSVTFQGTYGHFNLAANGSFTYTADNTATIDGAATGAHLTDAIQYTVSDGHGGSTSANVTFTLDRPPTAVADAGTAVESASGSGNVLTNDSDRDGDSFTVSAVNGVAGNVGASVAGTYGHITIAANGAWTYNADKASAIDSAPTGAHLTDAFAYTANDGHGATATQTVTVTLDRPPAAVNDSNSVVESATLNVVAATGVLANDSDRDGDTLTVSAVAGSAANVGAATATTYGHITLNADGSYSYAADNTAAIDAAATGAHLTDTVAYTVSDGHGASSAANLVFTLDRPPTTANDTGGTVAEGGGTSKTALTGVLANDSDRDADALVVSAVGGSAANVNNAFATTYGHITLHADGSYSYTADNTAAIDAAALGAMPLDSVSVTVSDGHGGTAAETLSFNIDRPVVANDDGFTTDESTAIGAGLSLFNDNGHGADSDPDNPAPSVASVAGGPGANVGTPFALASGALLTVHADGTFAYDPNHAFDSQHLAAPGSGAVNTSATDTFSYTLSGGGTATVTVTVDGVDNANTIYKGDGGNNTIVGDATLAGLFDLRQGGNDNVTGGAGDDGFYFGGAFDANDVVNGGGGTNNQIGLEGDYHLGVQLSGAKIANIQAVAMLPGFDYTLTSDGTLTTAGQTFSFWSASMGSANHVDIDMHSEAGNLRFFLGAGNDVARGGSGNDLFYGEGGTDTLTGNGGNDTFAYLSAASSNGAGGTAFDTITDFTHGSDRFHLLGTAVTAIDAPVSGALTTAGFDSDLAALLGNGQANELDQGHAVLFTVTGGGSLDGDTFLIVGTAGAATGYAAGQDYVIQLQGAGFTGLAPTDFM